MAAAVVMLHHSKTVILSAEGPLRGLCIVFQEGICRLAVPCFFLISGYLFFNRLQQWDWDIWGQKMKNRAKTLLIPYLLWNIIAFFAFWGLAGLKGDTVPFVQEFHQYGGFRMFWSIDGGLPISSTRFPINGPLWFIRDLMYYIIVSPLVYLFVRWTGFVGTIGMCAVYLVFQGLIPEGLVFFVIGSCLQLKGKNIVEMLLPVSGWLYGIAGCLLIATCCLHDISDYWCRFCKFFFIASGIGASFCIAAKLLIKNKSRVIPFLAGSSFFIFASHEVLILQDIVQPLVYMVLPGPYQWQLCMAFFLCPALTVAICLGLLFVMKKLLPRTTGLLTGNRKVQPAYNS